MARTLDVYFEHILVGHLSQNDGGQMMFEYASTWLKDPENFPLSHSLPLRENRFRQQECKGFFGGVLPEEGNRKHIARILQISERNDFAMLELIGGECAGAISFVQEGKSPADPEIKYRELKEDELAEVLRTLTKRPLLAGEKGVRLSLAGAQDKIAVKVDDDGKIFLPLNYAPSTHILKPAIATWEGIVANEYFCMTLARSVGINAARTRACKVDQIEYLLCERFDRVITEGGRIHRLHQEDFCQALGIASEIKYQAEGGPGLKDCFALLREVSSNAVVDLRNLLDSVIFNLLIGNNDAHAKNYSILCGKNGTRRLAPLYDLVCTVYYPEITNTLAMKIGRQVNPDLIYPKNIELLAKETGLASGLVRRRIPEFARNLIEGINSMETPDETSEQIASLITRRCKSILSRFE